MWNGMIFHGAPDDLYGSLIYHSKYWLTNTDFKVGQSMSKVQFTW